MSYIACIVTVNDPPPIPMRGMDWVAYDDRRGADDSPYGYGATEAEAIDELVTLLEELDAEEVYMDPYGKGLEPNYSHVRIAE